MTDPDRRRSPDGCDDDAIFADIVAHLNDEAAEPERAVRSGAGDAAPDRETTGETTGETTREATRETTDEPTEKTAGEPTRETTEEPAGETTGETTGATSDLSPGSSQALPDPQVWRAHEVDDEYEEHFEPQPVAPLPVGDLQFWAILAGMVGGPLLLVYLVFFNRNAGSSWILVAIALSVGGFALLVNRLPGHDDDDDDGARL